MRMTLHPINQWIVPEDTALAARASFPKGNIYMKIYDHLGGLYIDKDFEDLFPVKCGQSAISPARLALITVMQFSVRARRIEQTTKEFEKKYGLRAGIEGTISQGVRRFDMRRTRYFGIAKTHLQNIASACAINLHRFFQWSNHLPKAKTRITPFASLRFKLA